MIQRVTINEIEIKSGTSKAGRGYNMAILDTGEEKLSMYMDKEYDLKFKNLDKIQQWKKGDEVTIDVEQNGEYLNFKLPSKTDVLSERIFELEVRMEKLEGIIANAQKKSK
jgi:hypothetical protein